MNLLRTVFHIDSAIIDDNKFDSQKRQQIRQPHNLSAGRQKPPVSH